MMGVSEPKSYGSTNRTSIALVSVFPLYTGTTMAVLDYFRALTDLGYAVTIYQLTIPGTSSKYPEPSYKMSGHRFPIRSINLPANLIFTLPKVVPNLKEDVIILTDPAISKLKVKFPESIVVFYDLREFSEFSRNPAKKAFYKYLSRFVENDDKIIAVSAFTKEMLMTYFKRNLNIQVVEHCSSLSVDDNLVRDKIDRYRKEKIETNVLYVAADRPYKNIKLFIKVAKIVDLMHLNMKFNFILLSNLRRSSKRLLKKEAPSNLEVIRHTDDLYSLYLKTDVLLYPSFIEGFGLPLAEAMSFGIPIIYSNRPPMTDIVGTYGIALDPETPDLWVKELISLSVQEKYEKMALLSYERSKTYSYDRFKANLSMALKNFKVNG